MLQELWNMFFLNIFLFWTGEHSPFYYLHSRGIETCIAHLSYACNSKQIAAAKPFSMAVIFHFSGSEKVLCVCESFIGIPHFLPFYLFKYENFKRWFLLRTEGPCSFPDFAYHSFEWGGHGRARREGCSFPWEPERSHRGKRFLGTRQGGHSHSQALVVLGRKHPSGPTGLNLSSHWETEKKLRRNALPPSHILVRASFTWLSSLQPHFFSLCSLLRDSTETTRRKRSENTKLAARKCTAIGSPNKTSQIPT